MPAGGALPYRCVLPDRFALPFRLQIECQQGQVEATDILQFRFQELFSGQKYTVSKQIGLPIASDQKAGVSVTLTESDVNLIPGAYHIVVDLLGDGRSQCAGRVGSTILYVKKAGESPQHIIGSMGLALCRFTRNRVNGGYFHVNNASIPPTYDPFAPETYREFLAAFEADRHASPETHTDGGLGYLYMAKAFRAMGEPQRAIYAEDELKWLIEGCFNYYSMRCGGGAMTMQPWDDWLAYDPDGPIDGEVGPGARSQWGCPVEGELPIWTVSLPRAIDLQRVVVDFGSQETAVDFDLQVSVDGEQYTTAKQVRNNEQVRHEFALDGPGVSYLRLRFLGPPVDSEMFVLDRFEAWGVPAGSDEAPSNWADLDLDAVASATRTYMPTMVGDWLDTDQSGGVLQLAVRAALYFQEHDADYARKLFARCQRPAQWTIYRSWTPDTDISVPLHRYKVRRESRERHLWGWWGYDGRVVEGVAWYCAAYPVFNDGAAPPDFFMGPVEACRDRIIEIVREHDGGYMPMPGNHAARTAHQYITSALIGCLAADKAREREDRAAATAQWCARMIAKLTEGHPTGIPDVPHMPHDNPGDTGPHYFYSLVEFQELSGPDPMAQVYLDRMPDFVWWRIMPDNGALREAGHRAAVPSVALWACSEHHEAVRNQQ